jgi:hypothetical protein
MGLTLSANAANRIRELFQNSRCSEPVAALGESAAAGAEVDDVADAIRRGAAAEELRAVAEEALRLAAPNLNMKLTVFVYERNECPKEDIRQLDDAIAFVLPDSMARALDGCTLDYRSMRFLILGADGIEINFDV